MKKFSNIFLRLAAGLGQRLKRLSALIFALFFTPYSLAHTSTATVTVFRGYQFDSVWFANETDMQLVWSGLGVFLLSLALSGFLTQYLIKSGKD